MGVEVAGQPGCLRVVQVGNTSTHPPSLPHLPTHLPIYQERDIRHLSQVTKKKKVKNSIRLHFEPPLRKEEEEEETPRPPSASSTQEGEGGGEGGPPPSSSTQGGGGRTRGLSSSLSSTLSPSQAPVAPDVLEVFSTEYLSIVNELKRMVVESGQAEEEEEEEEEREVVSV